MEVVLQRPDRPIEVHVPVAEAAHGDVDEGAKGAILLDDVGQAGIPMDEGVASEQVLARLHHGPGLLFRGEPIPIHVDEGIVASASGGTVRRRHEPFVPAGEGDAVRLRRLGVKGPQGIRQDAANVERVPQVPRQVLTGHPAGHQVIPVQGDVPHRFRPDAQLMEEPGHPILPHQLAGLVAFDKNPFGGLEHLCGRIAASVDHFAGSNISLQLFGQFHIVFSCSVLSLAAAC